MSRRGMVARWSVLAVAFLYVAGLAAVAFLVKTETSEATTGYGSSDGAFTSSVTITTETTLWNAQGAPIAVILGLLVVVVLVGAASLAWRASRRSTRPGIGALVAAGLLGLVAFAALLSVGIVLLPVVAALVFVGMPLPASVPEPITA